jgi:hypothetical protein
VTSPDPERLEAGPPAQQPVVTTTLVCPPLLGDQQTLTSRLTVWSPPGLPGQEGEGAGTVRALDANAEDAPSRTLEAPGDAAAVVADTENAPPLLARGVGALAPGLAGDTLTVSSRARDRGLSSVQCAEPNADAWFVGGGSDVGRRSTLVLSNADSTAAALSVDVYSRDGLVDAPAGRGIVVPPRTTRTLGLDALAPGAGALAVRIRVDTGRISSALRDTDRAGLRPRGSDYVPQAAAPAERVIVPGLPGGAGVRQLRVVVPGDADATVNLRILGREESFAPEGADVVQASAGRLTVVDLTSAVDGEAVALELTSDQPLTAGVFVRLQAPGTLPEFAWTAAASAVSGGAAAATNRVGDGWAAAVHLAAPDAEAEVDLLIGVPGGELETTRVTVPAGRSTSVSLGTSEAAALRSVLVLPVAGTGPVHAARIQRFEGANGDTVTTLPLRSLRLSVDVPQAAPDLSVGLGAAEG